MTGFLDLFGTLFFATASLIISVVASAHIVLRKRDTRAAIGWVGVVWLAPFIGAMLYLMLGINRIQRRASRLRGTEMHPRPADGQVQRDAVSLPPEAVHLSSLAALGRMVTQAELCGGNSVSPLVGGEAAYGEMIAAIDAAKESVAVASYIFDHDQAGLMFANALERAIHRGLEIRVLIDGLGAYYSWPQITKTLHARGIICAKFMHSILPWRMAYLNLRSHRKLVIVDGRIGFTGGMNIRAGHLANSGVRRLIQDVHFRIDGPVVTQLASTFEDDWRFTTGERLAGPKWFPKLNAEDGAGRMAARVIVDGPDREFDRLNQILMGAVSQAVNSVRIVTPYFLPDRPLLSALTLAALKGVKIDIVIPRVSNLPLVQWATCAQLGQILQVGAAVWLSPPPFDHSKIMTVDRVWSFIGSTNWDTRSLRLNFELSV
ncbi:MAG: phospholipase D-like domain-containing protein, partial [Alphaproteobacteria bacterium]|nr:phospholipase D-like domain-containing protein [Alphaproteobacteria bacterium]